MLDLPSALQRDLIMSVGTHRRNRPLSPVEVGEAIESCLRRGVRARTVANALQLDVAMVNRFQSLTHLAPSVTYLVGWRSGPSAISLTAAAHLARLSVPQQCELAAAALRCRMTSKEVQQVVQVVTRAHKHVEVAVDEVCRLRPTVSPVYVFVGAVLEDRVRSLLSSMRQSDRDELLARTVRGLASTQVRWSGRLGSSLFALTGDAKVAAWIAHVPGGFEAAVNRQLTSEVSRK